MLPSIGGNILKRSQVDELEKFTGQLSSFHSELSALAKKSPSDAVNPFKLKFVNITIANCNKFLADKYKPFDGFEQFDTDEVPSNSDLTFIISQYMQAIEKYRSDNIYLAFGSWYYKMEDSEVEIHTAPPAKLKK